MKLVYAKNCDIYYDSKQGMIVFSKRGVTFVLRKTREDMEIIKEIIRLCYNACDIERIFSLFPEEKRKKYLSFVKLLWQKKILVADVKESETLNPAIMDFLIANYDADECLIEYWTNVRAVFLGCKHIQAVMENYGIHCANYVKGRNYRTERLFIGDFSKQQCKTLLNGKSRMLLYRESEGTSYILYMDHYDEDKFDRFSSFVWKENSSFYAKKSMIPFHLFMHFSNCYYNTKSPELLCITDDGTVHPFSIGRLYTETAAYFNRETIPVMNAREALFKIEELSKHVPYLVAACNKNNEYMRQSPICNYELIFGSDFGNRSYMTFHESYEKAALLAFSEGLEMVLNEGRGNKWCCGISREDYYAKGYISLLENRNECHEVQEFEHAIAGRICYLEEVLQKKIKVYYRPSPVEGIGGIVLCDEDDFILIDGKIDYQLQETLLTSIYKVIGERQICKKPVMKRKKKISDEYTIAQTYKTLPDEMTSTEAVKKLQEYYGDMGKIIDEKIWAYQVQIQETGMHVGKFFFVR